LDLTPQASAVKEAYEEEGLKRIIKSNFCSGSQKLVIGQSRI